MDIILDGVGNPLGQVDGIHVYDAGGLAVGSTGVNAAGNRTGRVPNNLVLDLQSRIMGRFERNRVFDNDGVLVGQVQGEHVFDVVGHLVARVPFPTTSDRIHAGAAALLLLRKPRRAFPSSPVDDG